MLSKLNSNTESQTVSTTRKNQETRSLQIQMGFLNSGHAEANNQQYNSRVCSLSFNALIITLKVQVRRTRSPVSNEFPHMGVYIRSRFLFLPDGERVPLELRKIIFHRKFLFWHQNVANIVFRILVCHVVGFPSCLHGYDWSIYDMANGPHHVSPR